MNLILETKIYALWTNLGTRSKTNLWLIRPTSENILGAGLPTNQAVLKYFFFLTKTRDLRSRIELNTQYKKFSTLVVRQKFQQNEKILAKEGNYIFQLLSKVTKESLQNANEL